MGETKLDKEARRLRPLSEICSTSRRKRPMEGVSKMGETKQRTFRLPDTDLKLLDKEARF